MNLKFKFSKKKLANVALSETRWKKEDTGKSTESWVQSIGSGRDYGKV